MSYLLGYPALLEIFIVSSVSLFQCLSISLHLCLHVSLFLCLSISLYLCLSPLSLYITPKPNLK
jgi:hypothetical protein